MTVPRHGIYVCQDPEADWIAMLADDPDLHLITSDAAAYDRAHPCTCDGLCTCESRAQARGLVNEEGTGRSE